MEYFRLPPKRVYKECNRYRIASTTLLDFGLEIINNDPKNATNIQGVWSNDNMNITAPKESNKIDVDKPFCCKYCGSENYVKYGKENNKQMYKCKECGRKFVDNLYFENMKVNPKIICVTLDLYFKGCSLRKISDHLKQFYDLDIHFTTIFNWIERYIKIMDNYVSQFKPQTSDVWNVDEMMINIDGDWFYLWNVIDDATRFHLASVISKERRIKDARKVLQKAKKTCGNKKPKFIITDGLQSYKKAINKEFHTMQRETIHVGNTGIRGIRFRNLEFDNNLIERLQGTIRDRNKTQRGLKSEDTIFIKGHQLYYNFIKPHESLNNSTPSNVAQISLNLGNNKWENLLKQSVINKKSED